MLVNLGCGTRMHPGWNNIDFSVYARLRRHLWLVRLLRRVGLLSEVRFAQFSLVAPDVIAWDLKRGIPFPDGSADAVYHSHVLEHLDRQDALPFLVECGRVLKPGGVLRVVVPDLERWADDYQRSFADAAGGGSLAAHERVIDDLLGQFVQRQPTTRSGQNAVTRWLERIVLGDSAAVGWSHRWMYDRVTLPHLLAQAGFEDCGMVRAPESRIAGWDQFGLDVGPDGAEYLPGSIRIEGVRRRSS